MALGRAAGTASYHPGKPRQAGMQCYTRRRCCGPRSHPAIWTASSSSDRFKVALPWSRQIM